MKFINNVVNETRKISGFSKEEFLEIKGTLSKFKSENLDQENVDDYLKKKISPEFIEFYSTYMIEIQKFYERYLFQNENLEYSVFKLEIVKELELISENLLNLSLNSRNIRRLLKNNIYLKEVLKSSQKLHDNSKDLISRYSTSLKEAKAINDNKVYLWIEINKIVNKSFTINENISELENWDDISELYGFIESINTKPSKKKKRKKKRIESLTFHFNDLFHFFSEQHGAQISFYSELIYILYQNKFLVEFEDEFVNILERKEIIQELKKFVIPIIKKLIEDKLKDIIGEIVELVEKYKIEEDKKKINLKQLLEKKISLYLPKIVEYYFISLEKKYQESISEVTELNRFKNIINSYSEKVDAFSSLLKELQERVFEFDIVLRPYEEITTALKKVFNSVSSEIARKKEEYLYYLKSVKNERLRDKIRNYMTKKIEEVNDLINSYQDEIAEIVREEFPQLQKIREILSEYKLNISQIKDDLYNEIKSVKEKNVEFHHLIKQWEDNFNQKKQQLGFLLSLLLKKIFKSFKDIIEEEGIIFDSLSEITMQKEDLEELPLNFAISKIMAEKMTEDELAERISELGSKISKLSKDLELHQEELSKLEDIMSTRVKMREGILMSDVKCSVCHKNINLAKEKLIKCPFCSSTFHYLCVAYWLSKYNSCPTCQNNFLDPNSGLFSIE